MTEPTLSRPVFSNEDFRLIRTLVADAIRAGEENEVTRKLVHLHHRLGRVAR